MAETSFDVIILGGGTGGYVAAIRAAQLGLKTALVDAGRVGGTCLHRGCIPTKALLHTAELYHTFQHRDEFGITADKVGLDYDKAMAKKDKVVTQLWKGVEFLLKKNKVTVVQGWGRLVDASHVEVAQESGKTTLTAKDIVLATGSVPRELPDLPFDGKQILSSDHILEKTDIPKSIIILGGGAIGVEFASMYNDFGANVTLIEMLPHILPQDDEEVAGELTKMLTKRGIKILAGTKFDLKSVKKSAKGVSAKVTGPDGKVSEINGEVLLVAVGRKAITEDVGLETVGVKVERGFVTVDDHYRTNVPHIYAIGDLIGGYLLAHVASHEGMIAVETIAGKNPELLDPARVPRVTYSRPEVASVGLTAKEAQDRGYDVKVGVFPFRANGKSLILGEPDGIVKLVADKKTDALLGAHIVGPHASDYINEMALARFLEATAWEVAESVHAHPTVSEVLHEAALAVDGHAIHI
ncbi:dihydrolipoyl dehydrogenase [Sulfobacillus harzensis]|uniref:Dihydrolipoyl dehydrogenase n=1 Tax=Sulfobacillus harzensis TaxID=2729629 RepID=A0A7Y0L0C5_9FIRM|nr:dihydrolipoyl dehydrogenase [Sulfobacillus harzensis]NMP20961.1 dihydrolipoyl dehydrogenase [Sulfobacillus harzensis]